MHRDLSAFKCFGEAWQFLWHRPGLAYGSSVVFFLLMTASILIPFLPLLVWPAFIAGYVTLGLNLVGKGEPSADNLFTQLKTFRKPMVTFLFFACCLILAGLPGSIGALLIRGWPASPMEVSGAAILGSMAISIANTVLLSALSLRWIFFMHVLVDEPDLEIMGCYRRSFAITSGNHWNLVAIYAVLTAAWITFNILLLLVAFVIHPIIMLVMFLLALPMISMYVMMTFSRAYLYLKGFHPRPVPATPPAPTQPLPSSAPVPQ